MLYKFLTLVTLLGASSVNAETISVDRVAHFGLSYVITDTIATGCSAFLRHAAQDETFGASVFCSIVGGGVGLSAGYIKEIMDSSDGGEFDSGDFAADALGVGLAMVLNLRLPLSEDKSLVVSPQRVGFRWDF